jgi:hypothetical protein
MEPVVKQWFQNEYKCAQPFDSVKRCHAKTFDAEASSLQHLIDVSKRKLEEQKKADAPILGRMKQIADLYRKREADGTLPDLADRFIPLIEACLSEPSVTDRYMRDNTLNFRDLYHYLR